MSGNRSGPFPNLDAYRAIGMVMVMTNHIAFASGFRTHHELIDDFIARFDISIPVFFMVSGFLLFRPYAMSLLDDRPHPSVRDYFRNRALRVLPAYWVALAGVFIWFGVPYVTQAPFSSHPLGSVAFYGMLLQTFSASAVFHGFDKFDQAWSIGTEVTFYLALPVLASLLRRRLTGRDRRTQVRGMLAMCAVLWFIAQVWRTGLVAFKPDWIASAAFWLPAHIDFFAIGMAMTVLSARERVGMPLPAPLQWLATRPWAAWIIAAALWVVVVNPAKLGLGGLFTIHSDPLAITREYVAKQFVYGFVGFFYLFPAVFGPQRDGLIRKVLGSRVMAGLGTVSMGFYLWHKAWLSQAEEWTHATAFHGSFPKLMAITFVGALACGTASYWLVERPFHRLRGRPITQVWRRQGPADVTVTTTAEPGAGATPPSTKVAP